MLALMVGLLLQFMPRLALSTLLLNNSYNLLFDLADVLRSAERPPELVMVYMDDDSERILGQEAKPRWDRSLHAQLLERLTRAQARAVIFDVLFFGPGGGGEEAERADARLAQAIADSGRVVLAANLVTIKNERGDLAEFGREALQLPYEGFRMGAGTNLAAWGIAQLSAEKDLIVRRHFHGPWTGDRIEAIPSLTWAAAELLGVPAVRPVGAQSRERWVNYYGGPRFLDYSPYWEALESDAVSDSRFRGRVVVVGAMSQAGSRSERRDEYATPFRSRAEERFTFMPAAEVHATMLLNLIRGDWLERPAPIVELGVVLLVAVGFGYGLCQLRPLAAVGVAAGGGIAIVGTAIGLFAWERVWFPWLVPVLGQLPVALAWGASFRAVEWYVQRRRMQARIQEQASLLDKARDAIMVHDLDWRAQYWNRSAEELYGWTGGEVLAQRLDERLLVKEPAKVAEARRTLLAKGEWLGEWRQPTRAGKEVLVESRWTLVRDEHGVPRSVLVINTDVTERKRIEAQLLRSQRMESIGALAGGIAHDLNNVLTPILMAVQLLQLRRMEDDVQRILSTVEHSAKRGADIVKQVLTFARGQEGRKNVLQLTFLVKEMEKIMRQTFPKSIRVATWYGENLSPVQADATQIHQILLNLCVNARDAMPEGGEVTVSAENRSLDEAQAAAIVGGRSGRFVALVVRDTGSGIPPEIVDRIFEPFFTTKEAGKGTGLGLSTVATIVKNHQGFVQLETAVGRGTTFRIYLPAAESGATDQAGTVLHELLVGHGELVLVVDDEGAIREMTKSTLSACGYRVLLAEDGHRAVSLCAAHKHDIAVAVIDMLMPGMDGAATMRALRRVGPELKFVAMTGALEPERPAKANEVGEGNVTVLPKPFTNDQLLEALRLSLNDGILPATRVSEFKTLQI